MAADPELLKKIEAIEDEIEKVISSKGFVTFIHLVERKEIRSVWNKALAYLTSKRKSLPKIQIATFDKLVEEQSKLTSQIKPDKEWSRWTEIEDLYNSSKENNQTGSKFLYSLTKNHLLRKEYCLPDLAEYALKGTIEADTQRLKQARNMPIERPDVSIILNEPRALLKDEKGNFDPKKTLEEEKKDFSLRSLFSVYSYLPSIQELILKETINSSSHPFLYTLYPKKADRAIWAGTKYIGMLGSRFIYGQIEKGLVPPEAHENAVQYVKVLPDRDKTMLLEYKGENLWDSIREAMIDKERMDEKDIKIMFSDVLNSMIQFCRSGLAVADIFFEFEIREANDVEKEIEGNEFSLDLFQLDTEGDRVPYVQETYAIVLEAKSLMKILDFVTKGRVNAEFYSEYRTKSFKEKMDEFINEPFIDIFRSDSYKKQYLEENVIENNLILNE